MEQINGFFYLMHKSDGTYLKLIPNQLGGAKVRIDEIIEYLASKRMYDYNKTPIIYALNSLVEPTEVKITNDIILPEQESVIITISDDALRVTARFYPPSDRGALMNRNDIIGAAVAKGVKFGLNEALITEYLKKRVYCTDIVIAQALMPVEGKDAKIVYFFNTKVTRKPKMNTDGTVDFHQLELINHVKENDVLAELIPMDIGKSGIDVKGRMIKQKAVHNYVLRHGKKIRTSEDGLKLISEVNGHVYLAGDKVFVSDLYEIKSDIDLSTGDIDYNGSVSIRGNVRTGFTVRANGSIFVDGVVEGATLISDAGIILSRGMQGMNRGKLITKGDVVAKFIENATVECDGSVTAEAILHSKIYAGKEINVTGKRGFVTGGELHSATDIRVKTAGSTMGTVTVLEVGIDPQISIEFRELEKQMKEYNREIYKLKQIIDLFQRKYNGQVPADKMVTFQVTQETYEQNLIQLEKITERFEELSKLLSDNSIGNIVIDKTIYSGCKLIISNITYYVRQEMFGKRFVKDGIDIKIYDHEG